MMEILRFCRKGLTWIVKNEKVGDNSHNHFSDISVITRGILHDTMRSKEMNKIMMLSPDIIYFNTLNQIDTKL